MSKKCTWSKDPSRQSPSVLGGWQEVTDDDTIDRYLQPSLEALESQYGIIVQEPFDILEVFSQVVSGLNVRFELMKPSQQDSPSTAPPMCILIQSYFAPGVQSPQVRLQIKS